MGRFPHTPPISQHRISIPLTPIERSQTLNGTPDIHVAYINISPTRHRVHRLSPAAIPDDGHAEQMLNPRRSCRTRTSARQQFAEPHFLAGACGCARQREDQGEQEEDVAPMLADGANPAASLFPLGAVSLIFLTFIAFTRRLLFSTARSPIPRPLCFC
ncbi:hypothetical protein C8J57DRAFT_1387571 [Mycena rebaudengoi]|nr:hypothetical protein C8J57DRAFT_1387571 [Mycena rebaudengoi]